MVYEQNLESIFTQITYYYENRMLTYSAYNLMYTHHELPDVLTSQASEQDSKVKNRATIDVLYQLG